jgi:DNA adenine methylase
MPKMKIKALAPWFGGKRTLAPAIIKLLGDHQVYWEPFCGSMAVLMAKTLCKMETVNDLNGDLVNLAKVIQDRGSAYVLYDKLYRTLYSEQLFKEAKERLFDEGYYNDEVNIPRAYDFFVVSWMGINGVSGTKRFNYQFAMRWFAGGGQGARRWQSVVGSIPAWHKRLRNVVIVQRDAFGLIDNIQDDRGVVIYCDPPYIEKSSKYVHDFTEKDHARLSSSLQRFEKARVIVSYYEHPLLEKLYGYSKWHRVTFPVSHASLTNAIQGTKPVTKKKNIEVLLINQEPHQIDLFSGQ